MKLTDLAAQLIMIDIPGPTLEEACRQHLRDYAWGGVILFARNITDRAQLLQLQSELSSLNPLPPLVAVDQEGGLVDRIRFDDVVLTPGPMALAATGDPHNTREAHRIMAAQLRELGFHLDFAPCVDINSNPDNPIIGVRSFGEDPQAVAAHGVAACEGLRAGGVGATAKHFPGHGDCVLDSHMALATIGHSMERLEQVELLPFQRCIDAKVEAMMTAHITFPALDPRPGRAATLSGPALQGLLREKMGFEGVIFTDSMEMKAIAEHYGLAEASILALEAGADMIISGGTYEMQRKAVEAIAAAVEEGRLLRDALEKSAQRIARLREAFQGATPAPDFAAMQSAMRSIVERSITLVRNEGVLPVSEGPVLLLSPDLLPLTPLGEMTRSDAVLHNLQLPGVQLEEAHYPAETRGPALDHLLQKARNAHTVLFTVYARHRLPDATREFGERLLEANPRTVLVSLSSPYVLRDLPGMPAFICSYNYTPLSLQALGRALTGSVQPQGQLPVSIPGLYSAGHRLHYTAATSR